MRRYVVKNLLRGLGISELPKIFTTHSKNFFCLYMVHPKTHEVKQICKKIKKIKTFNKIGEKRRYEGKNRRNRAKEMNESLHMKQKFNFFRLKNHAVPAWVERI